MTRLTTSGSGYGYSDGLGLGYGYGDGYGDGYGNGFGSGYGFGYSDGLGEYIGQVGYHDIEVYPLWGLVQVGCMVHTLTWWEQHWQQAAVREDVDIDVAEADVLLAKARSIIGSNCKS